MTINQFIQQHYLELLVLFKKITHNHQNHQDLLNDCVLNLLEKGDEYCKQLVKDEKVINYLSKMAKTQFNSKTSPFHLTYRNPKHNQPLEDDLQIEDTKEEQIDIDRFADDVRIYIGNLNIYERTIANRHFEEGKSQRELSKQYNINRIHISKTIRTIKSNIQLTFKKEDYEKD